MKKAKVAAYCRVSTNSEDQKNSFDNQLQYFKQVAKESEKYNLVKIYADEGISAVYLRKREQFLKMIFDAGVDYSPNKKGYIFDYDNDREPKFSKILVKDITRFSRNMDIIPLYRCLIKKGVSLVLTNQGLELSSEKDEFYLSLLLSFAQQESVDRGEKVRFGLKRSAERGVVHTNNRLYGYHYDKDKNSLSVIEEEAKVIRLIFDLYVNQNMGIRRIQRYLTDQNVLTRAGKPFVYTSLNRILSNRKYIGDSVRFKFDSGTVLDKNITHVIRPEEEWSVHEDVIPPIVSKEIFENAQELKETRKTREKDKGRSYPITEYSGLVKCKHCGAFYGRNSSNGKFFLTCMTKKKYGVKACDYPNINMVEFESILNRLGKEKLYDSMIYQKNEKIILLEELRAKLIEKMKDDTPSDLTDRYIELEQLEEQKNKLLDLYLNNKFNKKELDERVDVINNNIKLLQSEIKEKSMPVKEIQKQIGEIDQRMIEMEQIEFQKEFSRKDILKMIDYIDTDHIGKVIHLQFHFKIDQTINKIIDKSIPELEGMKLPSMIFTIKTGHNVPPRIPKNLFMLRNDVNIDEHIKTLEEQRKADIEEYKRIMER